MQLIIGLDHISDNDGMLVGGKAAALATLKRTGHPVPQSFCLTTDAYELFVERGSLRPILHQELGRKNFEDMRWEEIWDASLRIRNRFLRTPVPREIVVAVETHLESDLPEGQLAVRSSAPGEDSGEASFAGLHESFVGVEGNAAVIDAVRGVWASLWSDRALLYRRELGIDVDTSSMAIVVQELIEGSVSGIAFGVHPTDPDLAVVESVYGLNQGLVDGTIEPDRWTLDRVSGNVTSHIAPGERLRSVVRGSQLTVENVPPDAAASPPLEAEGLAEVFAAARSAGDLFGAPQDVEWTIADGKLVLLQSRPVTTAAEEGDKRAWYLSLTRSLANLRALRVQVEHEALPAMEREANELALCDLGALDARQIADEIERRRAVHDRWVDVYWRDFIPMAHGIRLFGQFYNGVIRPEDPYEFMGLLAATPMLSVRRNQALERLASKVRKNTELRARLEAGERGDDEFERGVDEFEREFGDAVFADQPCFSDRTRLVRLVLAMAAAPETAAPASATDIEQQTADFIGSVEEARRDLARELLDIGRASYQLRDDDNIYIARLESLVLDAVENGRRLLRDRSGDEDLEIDLDGVVQALRHPNLVVEPKPTQPPPTVEDGFRARPRQLVGQPAGPGVATAPARVIDDVADLFEFQAGEVLICDAVDPNMTFVVPMAAAVVERRGGMLIHGAIIAREYGLPCVTGVPDVNTLIATGDRVTVDGYLGIVTVL